MEVGEVWSYRQGAKGEFTPVKILVHGTNPRRKRTKVKFLDDQHEAIEEWHPTSRLWCLWKEVEEFTAREQRWEALRDLSDCTFDEEYAAYQLLKALLPGVATVDPRGSLFIRDLQGFLRAVEWDESRILNAPAYFCENGEHLVPWPITKEALRQLTRNNPLQTYQVAKRIDTGYQHHKSEYHDRIRLESWGAK